MAQAIVTDAKGIVARDIQLQVGGTAIPAYDARPEKAGRYPIVVVISGFTGNSEQNKDVVRRFAQAGYYAIAPELYHREGGMQGKNFQEMGQISGKVTRAQYLGDIGAAADYAKQQPWARADRLGVTGSAAGALDAPLRRGIPGGRGRCSVVRSPQAHVFRRAGRGCLQPRDKIKAPVLGLTARQTRASRRMTSSGSRGSSRSEASPRSSSCIRGRRTRSSRRPAAGYKKEASEDAWKRCVAFFDKYLKT